MSSRRRIRRNACRGKVRYVTQEDAARAVRSIIRAGKVMGSRGFLHAYRCPFCAGYHTGHTGI